MLTDPVESAIYQQLARVYVCTLEELSGLLPRFPAAQVEATAKRLVENGSIACRSSDQSRLLLWLPPLRSARRTQKDAGVSPHVAADAVPDYESAEPGQPVTGETDALLTRL